MYKGFLLSHAPKAHPHSPWVACRYASCADSCLERELQPRSSLGFVQKARILLQRTHFDEFLLLICTLLALIYYATHIDAWPLPCQRVLARLLRIPSTQLQNERLSEVAKYRLDVVSNNLAAVVA